MIILGKQYYQPGSYKKKLNNDIGRIFFFFFYTAVVSSKKDKTEVYVGLLPNLDGTLGGGL